MEKVTFRNAVRKDVSLVMKFIKGLAEYENMLDQVVATKEQLDEWLFEEKRGEVFFLLENEKEVGFALYFYNFSTFAGKAGIFLEDLFVLPEFRKKGYGKEILKHLAQIGVERKCGRIEWLCLNWNRPSIDFYLSIGAKPVTDWSTYRMDEQTMEQFAK